MAWLWPRLWPTCGLEIFRDKDNLGFGKYKRLEKQPNTQLQEFLEKKWSRQYVRKVKDELTCNLKFKTERNIRRDSYHYR